jgi:mannose-6-phosphate isomerase-like protein (cupin superfamily)
MLAHSYSVKQVLVVGEGQWQVTMGRDSPETFEVGPEDTISVPAGVERSFQCTGGGRGVLYLATSGDLKADIHWAPETAARF